MNPTKNNVPLEERQQLAELLNARLAETIDLHWQAKQAHWNVKGESFIALHELFDAIADRFDAHSDLLAERIVVLGGQAEGTIQVAVSRSQLPVYPTDVTAAAAHVDALSTALATFGGHIRAAIDSAEAIGDKDTADLFTEISRAVDKDTWFVEAHLNRS